MTGRRLRRGSVGLATAAAASLALAGTASAAPPWSTPAEVPGLGSATTDQPLGLSVGPSGPSLLRVPPGGLQPASGPNALLVARGEDGRVVRGRATRRIIASERYGATRVVHVERETTGALRGNTKYPRVTYALCLGDARLRSLGARRVLARGRFALGAPQLATSPRGDAVVAWERVLPNLDRQIELVTRPAGGPPRRVRIVAGRDVARPVSLAVAVGPTGRGVIAYGRVRDRRLVLAVRTLDVRRGTVSRERDVAAPAGANGPKDLAAAVGTGGRIAIGWTSGFTAEDDILAQDAVGVTIPPGSSKPTRAVLVDDGRIKGSVPGVPAAAVDGRGRAVFAFTQTVPVGPPPGSGLVRPARLVPRVAVAPAGEAFAPARDLDDGGVIGDVAVRPDGRVALAWGHRSQVAPEGGDGPSDGLRAVVQGADGTFGPPEVVDAADGGSYGTPALVAQGDGRLLLAAWGLPRGTVSEGAPVLTSVRDAG